MRKTRKLAEGLVPSGKPFDYYNGKAEELSQKLKNLPANAPDADREKIQAEYVTTLSKLALCPEGKKRYEKARLYCETLWRELDIEGIEFYRKELETPEDSQTSKSIRLLVEDYLTLARIGAANARQDREAMAACVPELEERALNDAQDSCAFVARNLRLFVDPFLPFDQELANEAKRTLRYGLLHSKRSMYASDAALQIVQSPQTKVAAYQETSLYYDANLLEVPDKEIDQFYTERVEELKKLLARTPDLPESEEFQALRQKTKTALGEACVKAIEAPCLTYTGVSEEQTRRDRAKTVFTTLAEIEDEENLSRYENDKDERLQSLAFGLLTRLRLQKSFPNGATEEEIQKLADAVYAPDKGQTNDGAIAYRIETTISALKGVQTPKELIVSYQNKLRQRFEASDKPNVKRLQYLPCLQLTDNR